MKTTHSIPHIWALFSGLMLILGPIFLLYGVLSKLYFHCETIPQDGFFAIGFFSTLWFWVLILVVYYVKIVSVSEEKITIFYPFRFKHLSYNFKEILKYSTHYNNGRFKDYESFHFQTIDGRVFMIMQFEYWNYSQITRFIRSHVKSGEISRYHNLKTVLIGLVISLLLTIGLIFIYNRIIINVC
jgi:hypothetical protein